MKKSLKDLQIEKAILEKEIESMENNLREYHISPLYAKLQLGKLEKEFNNVCNAIIRIEKKIELGINTEIKK